MVSALETRAPVSAQERRVLAEEGPGRRGSWQRRVLGEEGPHRGESWQRRVLAEESSGRKGVLAENYQCTCT